MGIESEIAAVREREREGSRQHAHFAYSLWEEFAALMVKVTPDPGDILAMAATNVAKKWMNPSEKNVEFTRQVSVENNEDEIIIKIRKTHGD